MNEIRIPIVLSFTIDGMVVVLRATLIKEEQQPFILIQFEPLYN